MTTELDADPLFHGFDPPEAPPTYADLSEGARRTRRQADLVAAGYHPLTKGEIHPLATRDRDARSPKSDPFTCGSCWYRDARRRYPKCTLGRTNEARGPYEAHSAQTDVRAWWPACGDYSPSDNLSSDAARYIPAGGDGSTL